MFGGRDGTRSKNTSDYSVCNRNFCTCGSRAVKQFVAKSYLGKVMKAFESAIRRLDVAMKRMVLVHFLLPSSLVSVQDNSKYVADGGTHVLLIYNNIGRRKLLYLTF